MEKTYNFKFVEFLSTNNTIIINNEEDFKKFKKFLKKLNMLGILKGKEDYYYWLSLTKINNCSYGYIIFEYNNNKGLTFGYSIDKSIEWYGLPPIIVDELEI